MMVRTVLPLLLFLPRLPLVRCDLVPEKCLGHPLASIPDGYDPEDHPSLAMHLPGRPDLIRPVVVRSSNVIPEISKVDDHSRVATMIVSSVQEWQDLRIRTNLSAVSLAFVSESFFLDCLWSPTLVFVNLADVRQWELAKQPISYFVKKDSVVGYISYREISVSCKMNFENYPFDKQSCDVLEFPFDYSSHLVKLDVLFEYQAENQRELQYHVTVEKAEDVNITYLNYSVSHSGWRICLKRRLNAHLMQTFLPTSLFVIASWISFLIPPEVVPGRMTLLVTMLLVEVNIFLTVSDEAPHTPHLNAISLWSISCITAVMAAVIQYGFVLYKAIGWGRASSKEKTNGKRKKGGQQRHGLPDVADAPTRGGWDARRIDRVSFVLFPAVTIVLSMFYWIHFIRKYESAG